MMPNIVSECKEPDIEFGMIVSGGKVEYQERSRIQVQCSPGYTMEGSEWIECKEQKWIPQTQCLAPCSITKKQLDTKNLLLSDGHSHSQLVKHNRTLEFTCKQGYVLVTPSIRQCVDGKMDLPLCIPAESGINCRQPPTVENGDTINLSQKEYTSGSLVQFKCQQYYTIEGDNRAFCDNGNWTKVPACLVICTAPKVNNGSFHPVQRQYRFEDIIQLYCNRGYEPGSHATTSKCTKYGWLPSPTCVPKRCVYPDIKNGVLSWANIYYREEFFPKKEGQIIDFRCYHGFLPENRKRWYRVTCTKLGWNPEPRCFKQCIPPRRLPQGHVNYTSKNAFIEGDNMSFECDAGYNTKKQERTTNCTENGWSPIPSCVLTGTS
ncbi:complement factor H-like isoform X2 [Paroedura picta]|uniref:complement factor H-like isoform X2 n=1 Tax=Paroedura picta TaxID=143630 RepID=UPI004057A74C